MISAGKISASSGLSVSFQAAYSIFRIIFSGFAVPFDDQNWPLACCGAQVAGRVPPFVISADQISASSVLSDSLQAAYSLFRVLFPGSLFRLTVETRRLPAVVSGSRGGYPDTCFRWAQFLPHLRLPIHSKRLIQFLGFLFLGSLFRLTVETRRLPAAVPGSRVSLPGSCWCRQDLVSGFAFSRPLAKWPRRSGF